MYETILIPTDGSSHAEVAAETGLELARVHDAAVHVVSVADVGPWGDVQLPGEAERPAEAIQGMAEDAVSRIADRAGDLDVTGEVLTGSTKTEIVDYADEIDADVIVMGTRGRGGVKRLALGSVPDHVIRHADTEVLVTSADED